jgi:hypothetical protein
MSWSKCAITIGKTGAVDAMAAVLTSIGTIKDKSTVLATAEGEKLTAKSTGGVLVAQESKDGDVTLTTRIMEPDYAVIAAFIGATNNTTNLVINTNVVADCWSVQLAPKNVGATGIKIRKASVDYKEGYSEDEGHFADVVFTVLQCADGELYTKYKKT